MTITAMFCQGHLLRGAMLFSWLVNYCLAFRPAIRTRIPRHSYKIIPIGSSTNELSPTALYVYDHVAGIDSQLLFDTWEWNANLALPAALVAGAVLATLIDGRETMSPKVTDKRWVRQLKKSCRLLLLSSFGLEVISIFVTVVMGTLLLSLGALPSIIIIHRPIRPWD